MGSPPNQYEHFMLAFLFRSDSHYVEFTAGLQGRDGPESGAVGSKGKVQGLGEIGVPPGGLLFGPVGIRNDLPVNAVFALLIFGPTRHVTSSPGRNLSVASQAAGHHAFPHIGCIWSYYPPFLNRSDGGQARRSWCGASVLPGGRYAAPSREPRRPPLRLCDRLHAPDLRAPAGLGHWPAAHLRTAHRAGCLARCRVGDGASFHELSSGAQSGCVVAAVPESDSAATAHHGVSHTRCAARAAHRWHARAALGSQDRSQRTLS